MNINNKEIERKFLIRELPENLGDCKKYHIIQAYISTSPTMRLRKRNDEYIFTFKGAGFIEKTEFEHPLTKEQFERLMKKTEGRIVEKNRYIVPLENSLIAELDIYEGELKDFMNVEVEFSSLKEAAAFEPPEWFGADISYDKRYSNASLALYGLPIEGAVH
ncbi:MAG: CYTH domain-containing protein [Clostridiales bacterium]|nr:CYTH domain-containing protein [Clostridiales bacterium]